ncbi:hypothetical protein BC833DRAFT_195451 [Globomyces pollinis-pini]|nr:hypothetical protein BC833DRAFT_195451 [Globomyces pollinis-pini]
MDPVESKNIVVIGGSCVLYGILLELKELEFPIGYRIIVIEKHSHAHYMFAFPRAAVISGFEQDLLVPYDNALPSEQGTVINAAVTKINKDTVELDRNVDGFGQSIPYSYLIYATGAKHPEPGNFNNLNTKDLVIEKLKYYQSSIQNAKKICIVGGGAVGVELAAEIKEHYPEKSVTLVHSRERYLPMYKRGMHRRIFKILKKLGVIQILGDRVILNDNDENHKLFTKKGVEIECDLMIPCTGMSPNSELIAKLSPSSVDPNNKYVKVKPTLQLVDELYPNIFAGGDVCDIDQVKVGFAAFAHAYIIIENIFKLIRKNEPERFLSKLTPLKLSFWKRLRRKTPKCPLELDKHKPVVPQIGLYLGENNAVGQYIRYGIPVVVGNRYMKKYFTSNIGADRAWRWLNASKP